MTKETFLHDKHIALGAKMVDFAGWEMPVQYTSIIEEHKTVRENVGLFDVSHMGEVFVSGKESVEFLNKIVPQDISKLNYEKAVYCQLTNKNGGLKNGSDVIATGDRLVITDSSGKEIARYTFVVYGDIDGNGNVDLVEIIYIKRHLLGSSKLEGAYLEAADANRSGEVDLADIISVKNQLLGRKLIKQD